jgi:hypothetical protein
VLCVSDKLNDSRFLISASLSGPDFMVEQLVLVPSTRIWNMLCFSHSI